MVHQTLDLKVESVLKKSVFTSKAAGTSQKFKFNTKNYIFSGSQQNSDHIDDNICDWCSVFDWS